MPDTGYPTGFDPMPLYDEDHGGSDNQLYSLISLVALGAMTAVGARVFALSGPIAVAGVTTDTTAVLTTVELADLYGLTEGESMIYASALRKGWTAEQAAKFINDMAVKRFLQSGQISEVAVASALAELLAVQQRAAQNQSVLDAAIIEAAARVNYQSALSLYFASGL